MDHNNSLQVLYVRASSCESVLIFEGKDLIPVSSYTAFSLTFLSYHCLKSDTIDLAPLL